MADKEDEKPDYLSMSDEDFLKANGPAPSDIAQGETPEPTVTDETDKTDNQSDTTVQTETPVTTEESGDKVSQADNEAGDKDDKSGDDNPPDNGGKSDDEKPDANADKTADKDKGTPSADAKAQEGGDKPAVDKATDKTEQKVEEAATLTPEAFMAEVMKPFKANGKEIKVNSPDEAIRLMQMGAGLGKKLQSLQPALKSLRLLEKHNLLDDAKLSYLIDLDQKNPEAIKKLIKESGIDPLDLNTTDPVTYAPTVRTVSDGEVAFSDALKELEAHPEGKATIREINEQWDATSKQVLFKSPELLTVIQTQKDSGIYAKIVTEIDRQKMLGIIPQSKPFLEAYKTAGDYLVKQGNLAGNPPPSTTPAATTVAPQAKVVVGTKVATPASTVANDDKAKAAAATKSTSARKAASTVNPLAMSDEEFMKISAMNL